MSADTAEPSAEETMPVHEFHRQIATELFNQVLAMLGKDDRTCAENDRMIHAAHASRFHWEFGGAPTNFALGEWQCARVHAALRQTESALYHAWRYLELAESYALGPFHLAHAHLAVAAAFGETRAEDGAHQVELARELLLQLTEAEERALIERELAELEGAPPATETVLA